MARKRRRAVPAERRNFDPQATFKEAGEAFDAGQLQRAETLLRKVLDSQPGSLECLNNLGFIQHLQGRTTAALDCYRRVLAIDPRHAGARFNLAKGLLALQRTGEAEAQL
ncbi:MAG: tetratricopeptide repeat protein, partial [Gammaproteobacteria bacterium]|nr:tetratricopeptide repeat protein [Gammaproteobacteria bacterium]